MRAYELHGVNDLRREDIEKPEIPSGWVLVQVKASGICSSDIPRIFTNGTYHFPTIPGHEFSVLFLSFFRLILTFLFLSYPISPWTINTRSSNGRI